MVNAQAVQALPAPRRTRGLHAGARAALVAFAACLSVALPAAAHAQQVTVEIRVVSEGVPVEGAQVVAGQTGGLTDAEGRLQLRLQAGTVLLQVTRIGYAESERSLRLEAGRDTTVLVELQEEAVHGEEILVVSTRTQRRIEDEPLRVEVVSREEVEEKLLMTPGDIGMLLNETAGLRVQPTAPALGGASVRIQGLRGRYTQILSDGLPLYGGQTGALGPLQIPPMDLGQVEVIKGAASALYGATAMGGIVNLISRRPENERELLLNQSTLGGTDGVLWLAGQQSEGPWGATLLASGHHQRMADVDDEGWADVPGYWRAVARPRVFYDDGQGRAVFVTVGGMIEEREGGTVEGGTTPDGSTYAENLGTRRLDAGLVGSWLLSDSRRLSARGSAALQRHDHLYGTVQERDEHRTEFAELTLSGEDGRHVWVLGAALQHDRYGGTDVTAFDYSYWIPGLFAQDEWSPTRSFTFSASARFDAHSEFGSFVSPRLSALYRPGPWVMRASVGTGFSAPSPFTEETEAVGLTRLLPLGDLEPERVLGAMLDVGRSLGDWELNATLFGSRISEPLMVRPDGVGSLELLNASVPVRTWGTELLARYHQGPIHLTATHVFTRSTEATAPDESTRWTVPLTPRNAFGLVGAYEVEGRGRAGVELYFTGEQNLDDNPYRALSENHWILGFLVERRFGPARLFLNLENVLDTRQTGYDPLVRPSRSPEGEWVTDVWAPLDGRAINGGVWFSF